MYKHQWLGGGLPIEFPTISLHESFTYPTSMFLRNLKAMDTEEMMRAQPMDAVILIGGCDFDFLTSGKVTRRTPFSIDQNP